MNSPENMQFWQIAQPLIERQTEWGGTVKTHLQRYPYSNRALMDVKCESMLSAQILNELCSVVWVQIPQLDFYLGLSVFGYLIAKESTHSRHHVLGHLPI